MEDMESTALPWLPPNTQRLLKKNRPAGNTGRCHGGQKEVGHVTGQILFVKMVTHSKKNNLAFKIFLEGTLTQEKNTCTLEWRMMDPWIVAPWNGSKYQLEARLQHDRDEHAEKASKAELIWKFEELIGAMVDMSREIDGCF